MRFPYDELVYNILTENIFTHSEICMHISYMH